jgi:hypothetical protein
MDHGYVPGEMTAPATLNLFARILVRGWGFSLAALPPTACILAAAAFSQSLARLRDKLARNAGCP